MKDKKDMTMEELMAAGLTSKEAAEIFETRYDPAIKSLVDVLSLFGMTTEQYHGYLDETKEALTAVLPKEDLPEGLAVSDAGPYLEVSDLMVLGRLAYEWWRIGQETTDATVAE